MTHPSYDPSSALTPQTLLDRLDSPGVSFVELASQAEENWQSSRDLDWLIPWALALWRANDYDAALSVLDRDQGQLRGSVDYLVLRGMILRRLPGRQEEAFSIYKSASLKAPERADIYFNMGNILRDDLQLFDMAIKAYQGSLQLDPWSSKSWLNYAIALQEVDRLAESAKAHACGLCLDPVNADAWNNAGLCALADGRIDQALRFFLFSVSLDSESSAAHVNAGNALVELLSPQDALVHLSRAVALEGESKASSNGLWNMSLVRLLLGDYRQGWTLYESRFATKQFEGTVLPTSGSRVVSRSELPAPDSSFAEHLLVWSEQGMGDSIQFCRYLLMLKELNVPFQFMSRSPLQSLMRDWLRLGDVVIEDKSTDPSTDARPHIPLMSLPHLFGTELQTVPVLRGYLRAPGPPPSALTVSPPPGGISIGITWASNPDNKAMYRKKSIPLEMLMPRLVDLMDLDLIEVHSLQVGDDAEQLSPWSNHPRLTDWNGRLGDFSDTAHVIQQLDLVLAVDTAVAHLAGALDRPTWLLLPANADFRWLQYRNDSPWYPSMRLFRQKSPNDWISVLDQVNEAFDQLFLLDIEALISSRTPSQLSQVA